MRVCFVQPNSNYQIISNKIAFSLTFPQIICNLNLDRDFYIYIDGRNKQPFLSFLTKNSITHVFITSITSNYPRAVMLARTAKTIGCITVLGGLFATLNSDVIAKKYNCFDYIIVGGINKSIISKIINEPQKPTIFYIPRIDQFNKPLNPIMLSSPFVETFDTNDFVCYELGNGCTYNCSFCTLRSAFGNKYSARNQNIIQEDLYALCNVWKRLKLIDDDIFQSQSLLSNLDFSGFQEIIVETRPNHSDKEFIQLCSKRGITHIITGVESFNSLSLKLLNKSADNNWIKSIKNAIELCDKYSITLRPVVMLSSPNSIIDDYSELLSITQDWQPENHVELLISMFTPHPGMTPPKGELLTNDLSLFDHLHLVFIPNSLHDIDCDIIIQYYNELVKQTKSYKFNPSIRIKKQIIKEYIPFFEKE